MITPVEEKKANLIGLIDDMTAAALDRSSHGYSQFLSCRKDLIASIDKYMEEDKIRIDLVKTILQKANEVYGI